MKPVPRTPKPLIAILDDDIHFCKTARLLLEPDYEVVTFVEKEGLFRSLKHEEPDLLLLDVLLGDEGEEKNGFDVYAELRNQEFAFPVVILTVLAGMDVTSRAMTLGLPFLQKDSSFNPDVFRQTVQQVLSNQRLTTELEYRRRSMDLNGDPAEWPWTDSAAGQKVRQQVDPFIENTLPVLLVGEWGTGKRTTGAWIHSQTAGHGAPFVVVNPLGQSDEEFIAEVFGTTAWPRPAGNGALRSAEGGTVYFAEFNSLPIHILVRLTEAASSGVYSPDGSTRRRRLACRIMGGCTRPLSADPEHAPVNAFWKPLQVFLPPLREHKEDLAFHVERLARQLHPGKDPKSLLSDDDIQALAAMDLPGNFYDLRTALIRGLAAVTEPTPGSKSCEEEWENLAAMSRMKFDHVVLMRYLRAVHGNLGKDLEAWMTHTGSSRSQVYRYYKFLKDADE